MESKENEIQSYPDNYIDFLRFYLASHPDDLAELEKAKIALGIKSEILE